MGSASLGWCLLALDERGHPRGVVRLGVRLFSSGRDPHRGTSLAVDRRTARCERRRRDRYLLRRRDLMRILIRVGLMPPTELERKSLEGIDPYELRARGLDEKLTSYEFGRALFHLHQRRGFSSNRRVHGSHSLENGKIRAGANRLKTLMDITGARTLGEFLYQRRLLGGRVRARLNGDGPRADYDFFVERVLVKQEFQVLWQAQARWHPMLTDMLREEIGNTIFRQRPLKPFKPGKCSIDPAMNASDSDGFRAPRALPIAQRFRILSELANLRVKQGGQVQRPLAAEEFDTLRQKLFRGRRITFLSIKKILGMGEADFVTLESATRDHLLGDVTASILGKRGLFGARWHEFPLFQQNEIVEHLLTVTDPEELANWLCGRWGLDRTAAEQVVQVSLSEGYSRLGKRALEKLVTIMERERVSYAEAALRAHYSHFRDKPKVLLEKLPYYGATFPHLVCGSDDPSDEDTIRYGRLSNPTVHIGLNQLRLLINTLIDNGERPSEIVIEVARDLKLSVSEKQKLSLNQAINRQKTLSRLSILNSLGLPNNGENRLRLRLWEELNPENSNERYCVYSNEKITLEKLFSPNIEIDHILPFSRTLDNSVSNKTVCTRSANRAKGEYSPFEAFGHLRNEWEQINFRAQNFPKNKRWRFEADAIDRWKDKGNSIQRHLNDTAFLARLAREYVTWVCPQERVWLVPGRLTSLLRGIWGLNSLLSDNNLKNRCDHRHHAIDAVVAALTDRSVLCQLSRLSENMRYRQAATISEPWSGFREELRNALTRVVVSFKPEHGKSGPLHQETAYGVIKEPEREGGFNLVYRKPLVHLSENEVARVRDPSLRQTLLDKVEIAKYHGKTLRIVLTEFSEETGIRRVRLMRRESDVIVVRHQNSLHRKAFVPGDNHHIDVFRRADDVWDGEAVTVFQANSKNFKPNWYSRQPMAKLVMRLHKGDMLRLEACDGEQIVRVVRLEISSKRIRLAQHHEGGELQKRHVDPDDPFRWSFVSFKQLRERKARKVSVDILGRIRDGGFAN